jgi:hypothetical protein
MLADRFVVKRSSWWRGQGSYNSKLLRRDGQMCCLGFYCLAHAAIKAVIRGVAMPRDIADYSRAKLPAWLFVRGVLYCRERTVVDRISGVNDTCYITSEQRETQLTALFAEAGVEVQFED